MEVFEELPGFHPSTHVSPIGVSTHRGTSDEFTARGAFVGPALPFTTTVMPATSGPTRSGVPHPRGAGSFARVLGRYVRERQALTLEAAVQKMSALPASRVGLHDRGTLREGAAADVAVFDPNAIADRATFTDPFQYAVGVKATVVNGGVSFVDGERGRRSGRALSAAHPAF